jgi:hypothetical protein
MAKKQAKKSAAKVGAALKYPPKEDGGVQTITN